MYIWFVITFEKVNKPNELVVAVRRTLFESTIDTTAFLRLWPLGVVTRPETVTAVATGSEIVTVPTSYTVWSNDPFGFDTLSGVGVVTNVIGVAPAGALAATLNVTAIT